MTGSILYVAPSVLRVGDAIDGTGTVERYLRDAVADLGAVAPRTALGNEEKKV
ncbi:hypothetical protein [Mycetohabitans rhizoxinica]|uniref:Uncharacterized protein n=1 Tax=Mycetohabitans rhizoxinica TaxID=412963 RepID=A0ABZ2PY30_9BURK